MAFADSARYSLRLSFCFTSTVTASAAPSLVLRNHKQACREPLTARALIRGKWGTELATSVTSPFLPGNSK